MTLCHPSSSRAHPQYSRSQCSRHPLVCNMAPALPHPRRPLHPRDRLHSHAPSPNLSLRRSRDRVLRPRCQFRHLLRQRFTRCNGRWLAHPFYRQHPLDAVLHLRGGLSHVQHLQPVGHRRSHSPLTSSQDASHVGSQHRKWLLCWLRSSTRWHRPRRIRHQELRRACQERCQQLQSYQCRCKESRRGRKC